jgi:hypothetical protein
MAEFPSNVSRLNFRQPVRGPVGHGRGHQARRGDLRAMSRPRAKPFPWNRGRWRVPISPATPGSRHAKRLEPEFPAGSGFASPLSWPADFVGRAPHHRARPLQEVRGFALRASPPARQAYSRDVLGTPDFRACSCKSSSFCLASSTDFCLSAICCLYCVSWVSQSLESRKRFPASE